MAIRIIVLSDGETWDGDGSILELTDEAYHKLECGQVKIKHLTDDDILSERLIEMGD
jgi:hypothetical protein